MPFVHLRTTTQKNKKSSVFVNYTIKFVKVLQFRKHGILRRECNALSFICDIIIYYELSFVKGIRALKFERLRKRKILCTTIMLSIDGQFMLKEAVTSPSFHFSSTEGYRLTTYTHQASSFSIHHVGFIIL